VSHRVKINSSHRVKINFTIEEEKKVKIKNMQYSAIGIALVVLKRYIFTSRAWASA